MVANDDILGFDADVSIMCRVGGAYDDASGDGHVKHRFYHSLGGQMSGGRGLETSNHRCFHGHGISVT